MRPVPSVDPKIIEAAMQAALSSIGDVRDPEAALALDRVARVASLLVVHAAHLASEVERANARARFAEERVLELRARETELRRRLMNIEIAVAQGCPRPPH